MENEDRNQANGAPVDEGMAYFNEGRVFQANRDYDQALSRYESALAIFTGSYGENNIYAAPVYSNMGYILDEREDYKQAFVNYEKALAIYLAVDELSKAADLYNNIGVTLFKKKDYDKALASYEKAFEIRKSRDEELHPKTADLHGNIANSLLAKGDMEQAIEHYQEGFKIFKTLFLFEAHQSMNQMKDAAQKGEQEKPAEAAAPSQLLLLTSKQKIPLTDKLTIGRMEDNDVVLSESHVSRHHCSIQKLQGNFFLKDEDSTNGTFLNGKRIPPGTLVELHLLDTITIGTSELVQLV